jgi:hypothetical protein
MRILADSTMSPGTVFFSETMAGFGKFPGIAFMRDAFDGAGCAATGPASGLEGSGRP